MTDGPHLTPSKRRERGARDARLGQALRDNLRRRKAQSRAREAPAAVAAADNAGVSAGLSGDGLSHTSNRGDNADAAASHSADGGGPQERKK